MHLRGESRRVKGGPTATLIRAPRPTRISSFLSGRDPQTGKLAAPASITTFLDRPGTVRYTLTYADGRRQSVTVKVGAGEQTIKLRVAVGENVRMTSATFARATAGGDRLLERQGFEDLIAALMEGVAVLLRRLTVDLKLVLALEQERQLVLQGDVVPAGVLNDVLVAGLPPNLTTLASLALPPACLVRRATMRSTSGW